MIPKRPDQVLSPAVAESLSPMNKLKRGLHERGQQQPVIKVSIYSFIVGLVHKLFDMPLYGDTAFLRHTIHLSLKYLAQRMYPSLHSQLRNDQSNSICALTVTLLKQRVQDIAQVSLVWDQVQFL
jgi:hypothetical protein